MTNKDVSAVFVDIYNGFWVNHRDHLPEVNDESGWDLIYAEGQALMRKYDCQLARDLVADLIAIMDQRVRRSA